MKEQKIETSLEETINFSAKGYVLGKNWGGGTSSYPTINLNADTIESLLEKAENNLKTGSLDSGMGFESLIGAILTVCKKTEVVINGKEFVNKEYQDVFIGGLTESQMDFLQEVNDFY